MLSKKLLSAARLQSGSGISDVVLMSAQSRDASEGGPDTVSLDLSDGYNSDDLLIFVVMWELNGGDTPAAPTSFIVDGQTPREDVAASAQYVSDSAIYSIAGSEISGASVNAVLTLSTTQARTGVIVYKVTGGADATVLDSDQSVSQNSSGQSVTVDFSSGVLVGGYYTGENQQHSWSGVDSYGEIGFGGNQLFSEGSYAHSNDRGDATHTVSTSHTATTNNQGCVLSVCVYDL